MSELDDLRHEIAVLSSALAVADAGAELMRSDIQLKYERIKTMREALEAALPIVAYVSSGRKFVDVQKYPDASARRVNYLIRHVLQEPGYD